jgi:hypothetical protein
MHARMGVCNGIQYELIKRYTLAFRRLALLLGLRLHALIERRLLFAALIHLVVVGFEEARRKPFELLAARTVVDRIETVRARVCVCVCQNAVRPTTDDARTERQCKHTI